jgi:signal transduction histidine kinase
VQNFRRALATIRAVAQASQGDYALGDVLARVCKEVAAGLGFDRVMIAQLEPDGEDVIPLAGFRIPAGVLETRLRLDDRALYRRACRSGRLVYSADARGDGSLPPEVVERHGVTSVFALPLLSEGRCIGLLSGDKGGEQFALDEVATDVLETMGALAATLLEKELVREKMRQLDEAKTQFISLASHELRTPVQTVYGVLATLHIRGGELREAQRVELRAAGFEQAERLRQLVDQLLDLSRIDAEAVSIDRRPVVVRRKVEEIVLLVAPREASGIKIEIPPELEADLDRMALDRIVSNLITNALRYGRQPITIAAARNDSDFQLRVEDRGNGVSPDFLPSLFDRFTRSEEAAATRAGTGLGLSIARAYARAHGGDLVYRDAEPHGACFELVIPQRNGR